MRQPHAEPFTHDRDCSCLGCCRKTSADAMAFLESQKAKPASLADQIVAVESAIGMPHGLACAAKTLRWVEQNADKLKHLLKQSQESNVESINRGRRVSAVR